MLFPNEPSRFSEHNIHDLLMHCHHIGASDITMQGSDPVFVEVHGQFYPITYRKLTYTELSDILNFIYGSNATAQVLSGVDIDTYYEFKKNRQDIYRFRVNGTGCWIDNSYSIQITFRVVPDQPPSLVDLHLPEQLLPYLLPQQGVTYIAGATGSGKSTLLASIVRYVLEDPSTAKKIISYESPIEYTYSSIKKINSIISQSEIPRNIASFPLAVRNALRRKPHMILIGESRDQSTIHAVIEAALTGHPVYTTLHSNSVAEAIQRLIMMCDGGRNMLFDILETIRLVVWQKLVPSTTTGRVAIREFLVFNNHIRDQLLSVELRQIPSLINKIIMEQECSLSHDAEKKFKLGLISERDFCLIKNFMIE